MDRRALTGYVGLSAAWSGGLVRSSGAWSAELCRVLMLCDASGAEFGLMQRRGPGVELAQNAWTVAK